MVRVDDTTSRSTAPSPRTRTTTPRSGSILTGKVTITFAVVSILGALLAASLYPASPVHHSTTSGSGFGSDSNPVGDVASYSSRIIDPLKARVNGLFATTSRSFSSSNIGLASTAAMTGNVTAKRTPVYFVSHGGPTTMYQTDHPVYPELQRIGKEITGTIRPSAVVVFSAHWQADRPNTIEVNVAEEEPLIYDFYGFPRHYYAEKFPNKGSPELARKVMSMLRENGIKTQEAERGLDHGAFVPFKVMFDPKTNPLTVPIVQVSLFDDHTDAAAHIRLGRAVQKLREENVLIVASGMSVHNLRDMMRAMSTGMTMPYSATFDAALKEAVETEPGDARDEKMVKLLNRPDARQAHPTFEHLLPIHIAVGAAGRDPGRQVWTLAEGSLAWAQYKFEAEEKQEQEAQRL